MPAWLLKQCSVELLPAITSFINSSLETGFVPSDLKVSIIRPLLKKDGLDSQKLENYRPVANLSFMSKILEKVVTKQLDGFISVAGLHEPYQSAYRRNHSTETALLKVKSDISSAVDSGLVSVLLMLDMSAAFDTVSHTTLISRLESVFGLQGTVLKWFNSYLTGRCQKVVLNGKSSEIAEIGSGVPQGSVLGPRLFTMYTQPLGKIIQKHGLCYHQYADDLQLYTSFKLQQDVSNVTAKIENCLVDINKWLQMNGLMLNSEKTELIMFTTKNKVDSLSSFRIRIGSSFIQPKISVRNLGVTLDSSLSMHNHVSMVTRSCYMHLRNISRIRSYLTKDTAKSLVHASVISRLDYANSLMFGISEASLAKLQKVQNYAARLICGVKIREHITPYLKQLHWLPVRSRLQYKLLLLVHKALNGLAPPYILELLKLYVPARNLRSSSGNLLKLPSTKTVTYGERQFSYGATELWNNLPSSFRTMDSLPLFKKTLKTYFFVKAFNMS